ncbi:hypothetical protein CEXT_344491 [Caerostris extrusa]|uniref:Uncharacterized protein n=1 Tax=Caerostris extrusa TaxID=172846 RepID=A0AAV4WKY4_CAEEX|nr:hypothetical protein CEXT_344491 [Caerostris extrusa]
MHCPRYFQKRFLTVHYITVLISPIGISGSVRFLCLLAFELECLKSVWLDRMLVLTGRFTILLRRHCCSGLLGELFKASLKSILMCPFVNGFLCGQDGRYITLRVVARGIEWMDLERTWNETGFQ